MRTKVKFILLIAIILLYLIGCRKEQNVEVESPELIEPVEIVEIIEPEETVIVKEGIQSPLSGIYAKEELVNRRVVGIMFDNHPRARWQAGLKDAEIVYEFQVEAPYTRYLGFYLINEPKSIGPIRSSRPYFVTKAYEYDAVYVRVGGSEQAKKDIINLKIADIDGLSSTNKVFWRNNNKKIPHNLYTSMEVIRETQEQRKYNMTGDYESFLFEEEDRDIIGSRAEKIDIDYKGGNTTNYYYNLDEKLYYRQKDGQDHLDESDSSQIRAKNIIIQEVETRTIDNEGRLDITLVGKGIGKYITNGVATDITWVKSDRKAKTYYLDIDGAEITLNPGVTWIQMVSSRVGINIE